MALDREAIFVALEKRIRDSVRSVVYVTRQAIDYEQIRPDRQPSIEIVSGPQTPREPVPGDPPVWNIRADLLVFARNPNTDPTVTAETLLNQIVTEIDAALEPVPGERPERWGTTLGGLVYSCFIAGPIEFFQGNQGGQSVATIPVEIVAVG